MFHFSAKHFFLLNIFFLTACAAKNGNMNNTAGVQFLVADTTNNAGAKRDRESIKHFSTLARQINLDDITKGAGDLEIRAWYSFAFSNEEELYSIKFIDSVCTLSYHRLYMHSYDFDDSAHKKWNPITAPVPDSFISKTVLLEKPGLSELHTGSIWNLKSQSELNIPDSIGFTDCDSYSIEIADKTRYKFMRYHCPDGYYNKTGRKEIKDFLHVFNYVRLLAEKYRAKIPY